MDVVVGAELQGHSVATLIGAMMMKCGDDLQTTTRIKTKLVHFERICGWALVWLVGWWMTDRWTWAVWELVDCTGLEILLQILVSQKLTTETL